MVWSVLEGLVRALVREEVIVVMVDMLWQEGELGGGRKMGGCLERVYFYSVGFGHAAVTDGFCQNCFVRLGGLGVSQDSPSHNLFLFEHDLTAYFPAALR